MDLHKVLEKRVANFVGKEDAVVFAMGYATNSCSLPALAGPVSLSFSAFPRVEQERTLPRLTLFPLARGRVCAPREG